jgi:hypothetical protein
MFGCDDKVKNGQIILFVYFFFIHSFNDIAVADLPNSAVPSDVYEI